MRVRTPQSGLSNITMVRDASERAAEKGACMGQAHPFLRCRSPCAALACRKFCRRRTSEGGSRTLRVVPKPLRLQDGIVCCMHIGRGRHAIYALVDDKSLCDRINPRLISALGSFIDAFSLCTISYQQSLYRCKLLPL